MKFNQLGKYEYRKLRQSGLSHSEAFQRVGSVLKTKAEEITKMRHMRNETRMIKPIDGENKRQINSFTRRFDIGTREKDEFMQGENEPISYADEIGGFKKGTDPDAEARKERIRNNVALCAAMNDSKKREQYLNKIEQRRRDQVQLMDRLITSGRYKSENGKIRIGSFTMG